MEEKLKTLGKESLEQIILEMSDLLSKKQYQKLNEMIDQCTKANLESGKSAITVKMTQTFIEERMTQIESWMAQIDEGELCLNTEEYEDYSSGYWEAEWHTDYYDNQGIGDILLFIIQFAKDCVDDRKYQEANQIYNWLWEMRVYTDSEYEDETVDFEMLVEEGLVHADLKQVALLTLYADYQVGKPEERAESIYLYFSMQAFRELHMEEMFHAGRENLTEKERFWKDWISLLKMKSGDVEGRLLQEAILYSEGIDDLVKAADEIYRVHPSLYLAAMEVYEKNHDYARIEKIGQQAVDKIDSSLKIRSEIALKAANAASCLNHTDKVMMFCWEAFRSDSTNKNFLRLFGTKEMAEQYGIRGKEVLCGTKAIPECDLGNRELQKNVVGDYEYLRLSFYAGDFEKVKLACKNPKGSLGWSTCFILSGINLFLLYLYENPLPSMVMESVAKQVGYPDGKDMDHVMDFESKIIQESRSGKISVFWNYFQRWKPYFPMDQKERKIYLAWAEKIVYSRADAIVSGQHRRQYGQVALLLAAVAEVKESTGVRGVKMEIYAEYKKKYPRHSSFQAEMKYYFGRL